MKTKNESNILKEEEKTQSKKLAELTERELTQVAGGVTETDRINIQKEIDESIAQIDDNALCR